MAIEYFQPEKVVIERLEHLSELISEGCPLEAVDPKKYNHILQALEDVIQGCRQYRRTCFIWSRNYI